MTAAARRPMTTDAYLAMERAGAERHEFHAGEAYAMAGATRAHNLCESFDRGDKSVLYRAVPSIREILLVSQKTQRVEHYVRHADGAWLLREHTAGDRVPLSTRGVELSVDEIYLKVFETGAAAR